jgi:hypothetical protein
VSAVQAPGQVFSGQVASVSWTVTNVGGGVTGGAQWVDEVFLSPSLN